MNNPFASRLSNRLIVVVGLWLLLFSIVAGAFFYNYSFQQQLKESEKSQRNLVRTVQTQAEVAVYALNTVIAHDILGGLLTSPSVLAVRIESVDGFRVEQGSLENADFSGGSSYPLYSPVDKFEHIGNLLILKNNQEIAAAGARTALLQTLLMLAQVATAVVILAVVLRRQAIKPISELAAQMASIRPGSAARLQVGDSHHDDEIGLLAKSANASLDATEVAIREREQVNQSLEDALAQLKERDRAKSHFFAAANHDLRQPIHAMNLLVSALKRSKSEAEQLHLIKSLETAADALSDLLGSLLDLSKLDAGVVVPRLELVSVEDLFTRIDNSFSLHALDWGLRFKIWFPRSQVALHTDKHLIGIILANIVGNALKNTTQGGVLLCARHRHGLLLLQVWDTGIGIGVEHLDHIYDEFYQIDNPNRDRGKGLGLGLSIAKRTADLLGYELCCRSTLGKGTVFEVRIPASSVHSAVGLPVAALSRHVVDPLIYRGLRFVVLEDDPLVSGALKAWLGNHGINLTVHTSAEGALADAQISDADCYIVDHQLAGALTGIDFLETISRRTGKYVNAIVVTGNVSDDLNDASQPVRWPILSKPVDPMLILSKLEPPADVMKTRVSP